MRFSELPKSSYFVVVAPCQVSLLLAKSVTGQVMISSSWTPADVQISADTEVQQVELKKRS